MARITVSKVCEESKTNYWQWCIRNGVSMSRPIRYFIEFVIIRQESWEDIAARLAGTQPTAQEEA